VGSTTFNFRHWFIVVFIACTSGLTGSPALADTAGWNRLASMLSRYRPSNFTSVQFPGADFNIEDDLQLDDSMTVNQHYASMRSSRQILLEGSYFELGRFTQAALNGSIQFGDTVFPVNIDLTSNFEPDMDGAHSPLPVTGLSFDWSLTSNLELTFNGDYLTINDDDFNGSIVNLWAGLRYRIHKSAGVGVGYDLLEVDVESMNASFSELVNYHQWGPKVFLSLRF
jgi:hypothetical protein